MKHKLGEILANLSAFGVHNSVCSPDRAANKRKLALRTRQRAAFTLVEMLVVIAIILLLVSLLLPALQRIEAMTIKINCIHNMRQLTQAWLQYTADNNGRLIGGGTSRSWDWDKDGANGGNTVAGITSGLMWPYLNTLKVYRCPADYTTHLRTYSVNFYLCGECDSWPNCSPFLITRSVGIKKPAQTFVFFDENDTRGYNMGGWVADNNCPDSWTDFVPNFHISWDNLSFADGHIETWHWQDPRTMIPAAQNYQPRSCSYSTPNNPDLLRLHDACGRY